MKLRRVLRACLALPFVLALTPALAEVYDARVTAVPDGDTLWVMPEEGGQPRKLRVLGIDAPEICQPGGVVARDALLRLLQHRSLRVTVRFSDVYARGLARISVDGQDVGSLMVRSGQAWSSRWHGRVTPYAAEEAQARAEGAGLFADADAELPRDFRQRHGSCYPAR